MVAFLSVQSTLALRNLAIIDTLPEASPGETHKEMTEVYSRYYRLSLLWKCGHFHNPPRDISIVFSLAIEDTSSKILTHTL